MTLLIRPVPALHSCSIQFCVCSLIISELCLLHRATYSGNCVLPIAVSLEATHLRKATKKFSEQKQANADGNDTTLL